MRERIPLVERDALEENSHSLYGGEYCCLYVPAHASERPTKAFALGDSRRRLVPLSEPIVKKGFLSGKNRQNLPGRKVGERGGGCG